MPSTPESFCRWRLRGWRRSSTAGLTCCVCLNVLRTQKGCMGPVRWMWGSFLCQSPTRRLHLAADNFKHGEVVRAGRHLLRRNWQRAVSCRAERDHVVRFYQTGSLHTEYSELANTIAVHFRYFSFQLRPSCIELTEETDVFQVRKSACKSRR